VKISGFYQGRVEERHALFLTDSNSFLLPRVAAWFFVKKRKVSRIFSGETGKRQIF